MPTTLPVKLLASLNQPGACERCFWLRVLQNQRLPFGIFPGIFSAIDSFSKRLTDAAYSAGALPRWLSDELGVDEPLPVPHYSRFARFDPPTEIMLRGAPDGLFRRIDRSYAISDFKTAKQTARQDTLIELYRAQLNAYLWIGEPLGYAPVTNLSLIYTEPVTEFAVGDAMPLLTPAGFILPFSITIVPVPIEAGTLVPNLLVRARTIIDGHLPDPGPGCTDCERLLALVDMITEGAACRP